jgi:uncharacterized phage protein (TIGR02218 family)
MREARNFTTPYDDTSFPEYLSGSTLTLATCWKLVPKIGSPVGATSHTRNLVLSAHSGVTFKSHKGIIPTAADTEAGLGSAGLEIDAIFDDELITEESISAGDWDAAYFEVFLVNYSDLRMGEIVMFAGNIGEIKVMGERFKAEGRPLTAKAGQEVGILTAPKCIVRNLGDSQCKVNLLEPAAGDGGLITLTGTVTAGGSNSQFTDAARTELSDYFTNGIVQFTSGILNGRKAEIKQHIGSSSSSILRIGTDATWKITLAPDFGWQDVSFDDSAWSEAIEQGTYPAQPWGSISGFETDTPAKWIWHYDSRTSNDNSTVYFRKTFTPNVTSGTLRITGDNTFTAYLDGVEVGTGDNWQLSQAIPLTFTAGEPHVLAIVVQNSTSPAAVNPGGLLAELRFAPYTPVGSGAIFKLVTPMPRIIPVGTTYIAIRGCDRLPSTCKAVYNNMKNIRAFPYVPGIEKAYDRKPPRQG